jgi:hypothetical protein
MVAKKRATDTAGIRALIGAANHTPKIAALSDLECPADIGIG